MQQLQQQKAIADQINQMKAEELIATQSRQITGSSPADLQSIKLRLTELAKWIPQADKFFLNWMLHGPGTKESKEETLRVQVRIVSNRF